jgi:hypothetical protein
MTGNPSTDPTGFTVFSWRTVRLVLTVLLAIYLIDALWFQLRISFPRLGRASGSVHRTRLLAIPDKGNKTEYQVDEIHPEEDVPCARALFPHSAEGPCWYVVRHAKDPIQM